MSTTTAAVQKAVTDDQILLCWKPVEALRPHLKVEKLVPQVREMMQEGYQMIYVDVDGTATAFAGFREMQMLYCGRIIYIDDLSTLEEHRGKGYAGMLLDFIHDLARKSGKAGVHLDSGYQRNHAHRLYLNRGYVLNSHHFANTFQ